MVVFHGHGASTPGRPFRPLAEVLQQRLRATDLAGLSDAGEVAVLLPATPESGAHTVADDVCTLCVDFTRLTYDVYVYGPSDREASGDGNASSRNSRPPRQQAQPLMPLMATPLPIWKRSLDVFGASMGLLCLSPVLAVIAALIKLTSPGPVIFYQERAGLGGRPFTMLKFRTMHIDAEAQKASLRQFSEQDGPAFKMKQDPRVTSVGGFLRRTSLDELPQLWNVLTGEMSLVGPRPLPVEESDSCRNWFRRRLDATPGLTCIWQVEGRSSVTFEEWMRMDARYVKRVSPGADLKLLLRTLPAVLFQRGAQ